MPKTSTYIQTPSDAANTGKKQHTYSEVIGPDTVHQTVVIPTSPRKKLGVYHAHPGQLTPPVAVQNGTTTGMFWLFNPIGATINMSIRRTGIAINFTVLATDLITGQFRFSRFTYTGTPSGAVITPARRLTADAAPQGSLRSASTGMTVSLVATTREELGPILPSGTGTGVVSNPAIHPPWDPDEDGQLVLVPGEGIVFWSALALTTANRRISANLSWEEYEP